MKEMIEESLRKYEFRRKLEELKKKHGRGTELISVYIPPDKQISDVVSHLRQEMSQASNIKSKSTRTNVISALDSIISRLKYVKKPPGNGIVFFCGAVDLGGDKTAMETHVIEPIEPITFYKYHCDSEFYLAPLEEMLMEKKNYGLLVIDRKEATVGVLRGKRIEVCKYMTSGVPSKHRKGGQSAVRFQRLREIALEEFFKRVGDHASNIFLAIPNLEGILVGGPSPTKDDFLKGEYMHYELRKKILGAFDVSYTDESGLYELVERAKDLLEGVEVIKEKRVVDRFMGELARGGKAAYGEEEIRKNLERGSVDTLLISEDLRLVRVRARCNACNLEENRTVKSLPVRCRKCGNPMEILEEKDVVKEFIELASQSGAKVEFISTEFVGGAQLRDAFGGIAAILRYDVGEP